MKGRGAKPIGPPDRAHAADSVGRSPIVYVRLLYLLVFASFGATGSYQTLYFRRAGLSNSEIGVVMGLQPIVALLAGPAWSLVADKLGMRSRLLTLVLALAIVPTLAMMLTTSFAGLLTLALLVALLHGPLIPLMDSAALSALGNQRHRYATVRAFGSLGYAPVAWATGYVIQVLDIRAIFVLNAVLAASAAAVSTRLPSDESVLRTSVWRGLRRLVRRPGWLTVMGAFLVVTALHGAAFTYTNLYMDALGASESLMGLAQAMGSAAQTVLLMTVVPRLLRRWGSERLLLLALAMFSLRIGLWALVPRAWMVGLTNLLNGLTFGAAGVAAVDFSARHAPPGLEATSQALASGLISGLGRSLGSSSAGVLYDSIGPRTTFGLFGAVALVASAGYGLALGGFSDRRRPVAHAAHEEARAVTAEERRQT